MKNITIRKILKDLKDFADGMSIKHECDVQYYTGYSDEKSKEISDSIQKLNTLDIDNLNDLDKQL